MSSGRCIKFRTSYSLSSDLSVNRLFEKIKSCHFFSERTILYRPCFVDLNELIENESKDNWDLSQVVPFGESCCYSAPTTQLICIFKKKLPFTNS